MPLQPDGSMFEQSKNKVYLRTLLYSTAKRGYVIESLYISLHRNETKQNFNIWIYGEKNDLKRGSGLFVPKEGVTFVYHFLLPKDGADFVFFAGTYKLSVFAQGIGQRVPTKLMTINLTISESESRSLIEPCRGIYFDWGPDQQSYHSHIAEKRPEKKKIDLNAMVESLKLD